MSAGTFVLCVVVPALVVAVNLERALRFNRRMLARTRRRMSR
jgi:hypothetical protein